MEEERVKTARDLEETKKVEEGQLNTNVEKSKAVGRKEAEELGKKGVDQGSGAERELGVKEKESAQKTGTPIKVGGGLKKPE